MRLMAMILALISLWGGQARGNTFGTDMSDLWWNPTESGWGVTITQQNEILFLTFFIYGADGKPVWFTAPNTGFTGLTPSGSSFSGLLYRNAGSWFGTAFNPAITTAQSVGSLTFTSVGRSGGTLVYTIDGVQVSKNIERQTWRTNILTGAYYGVIVSDPDGCIDGGPSPPVAEVINFNFSNSSNAFSMVARGSTQTCTYSGNYAQFGRMGQSTGSYSCTGGKSGTYTAFEIEASPLSISGQLSKQTALCLGTARFSAATN